jgi:integrase
MASVYARGDQLWCRVKDATGKWICKRTIYTTAQRKEAERYAEAAQKVCDDQRAGMAAATPTVWTVRTFSRRWLNERRKRGLRSVDKEESRIRHHVLPKIGDLRIDQARPRDIRDLVRGLQVSGGLAPRTIHNVYGDVRTMFGDALSDELIPTNPCVLKRGDLPAKVDKDPEWRTEAVYDLAEVERLISDPDIPPERRVLNALKALAGLRHGEAAGLRWRHFDDTLEPLGRLLIATSYDSGRTKTDVTRRVPVHPTLAKILTAWRDEHWARVYGRARTDDDLIVPTRAMNPIQAADGARMFKADLKALGLRTGAGQFRDRGGHDLRAWFITTCQENGAHRDLLRVVTHTGKGDIVSGYTRASWPALCAEVAKLKCAISGDQVLELATGFATGEKRARNRWVKLVGAVGVEPTTCTV